MDEKQKQIIRQSSLKSAVDYFKLRPDIKNVSLSHVIGVCMAFEEYATTGSYELAKKIEKKLDNE